MTRDRWLDTVTSIVDRFKVLDRGQQPLKDEPGTMDYIEFEGPVGHIRLEFVTRPRIVGKKTHGGRRVGTAASVSYEYSPDEEVHELVALRQVNGSWQEMDGTAFVN